jgi:hypothetical protein
VRRAQSRERVLRLLAELRCGGARVFSGSALCAIQLLLVYRLEHLHLRAHFFKRKRQALLLALRALFHGGLGRKRILQLCLQLETRLVA